MLFVDKFPFSWKREHAIHALIRM